MDKGTWLAQVQEEIVDPERKICDPHHHLWDHPGSRYLLDELLEDTNSGHNIVSTVFVECSSMYKAGVDRAIAPIGETEFVQGIAAMSASGRYGHMRAASGIVSFADLTLGDSVRDVLQAHMSASANRFKGIRHAAGWHASDNVRNSHTNPPEGLMLNDNFREGLAVLNDLGLTFDAWFYHHQLPEFIDLAKAFPNVTIILDHFGGPLGIGPFDAESTFNDWRDNISELKDCKNVHFKLGGVNMKINGFGWHNREVPPGSDELVDKTARYYDHCIDTFGADRCMFESNFPVDKESCSYQVLWNAFKKIAANRTESERAALFHDTATNVYSLAADL
ncbi:MAG: amidohydrolase family protein [Pseudomonadales bacterium]|jgi:predicted TIM-barrel fold metal-dependent hydrolase